MKSNDLCSVGLLRLHSDVQAEAGSTCLLVADQFFLETIIDITRDSSLVGPSRDILRNFIVMCKQVAQTR